MIRMNLSTFFSFLKWIHLKLYKTVVTAIQGLIDAADEQLYKRENSVDSNKVMVQHFYYGDCDTN